MAQVCIFEDDKVGQLNPLVYATPAYELRCGIKTLREKIQDLYPKENFALHCRSYLADCLKTRTSLPVNQLAQENTLFINGRAFADFKLAKEIPVKGEPAIYMKGNTLIAARVDKKNIKKIKLGDTLSKKNFVGKEINAEVTVIDYFWDFLRLNADTISKDSIDTYLLGKTLSPVESSVFMVNKEHIFVGKDVTIKPGVVLDATNGPIFIDNNACILPNVTIMGPVYIGFKTVIKCGAKIYGGTTIGPVCKIGGEVENCIIQGYSNKAHDGFLGSSYLGSWVNLGAGTENSNLKNNYKTIKVNINGKNMNTGTLFVGVAIGDHTKTSIKTMFNSGTIIGFCCNLFDTNFHKKEVPSFAWGSPAEYEEYDIEKAIATAKAVMQRREVNFSAAHDRTFRKIFELTKEERKSAKL